MKKKLKEMIHLTYLIPFNYLLEYAVLNSSFAREFIILSISFG